MLSHYLGDGGGAAVALFFELSRRSLCWPERAVTHPIPLLFP
jgi:hypothetical protein